MKKNIQTLLLMICFLGTSCANPGEDKAKIPDYHVAVIETTGETNESYLNFYDTQLKNVGNLFIQKGSMGSFFDLPRMQDKSIFVIPQGTFEKELDIVLELNMDTGVQKQHKTGQQAMNSFAVDQEWIYTVHTINAISTISKCNKMDGKLTSLEIKDHFIGRLDKYENILYAFGTQTSTPESKSILFLIDPNTLEIIDTIDITQCGASQEYSAYNNGYVYFTNQYDAEGNPGYHLSRLDTATKTIENIKLQAPFPFQIHFYQDKILISHYDLVGVRGNQFTILNPVNLEQQLIKVDNTIGQTIVYKDKLYVASLESLSIYSLGNFQIQNTIPIQTKDNGDTHFYVSSFFIKETQ